MAVPMSEPHLRFETCDQRVQVVFAGTVVADSVRTVLLHEGQLPPTYYFPREDVRMALFQRTAHSTYCPFKGNAAYWSLRIGARLAEDVLWSYEQPYEEAAPLADYVAFYTDRVDALTVAERTLPASPSATVEGPYANPLLSWLLTAAPAAADAAELTRGLVTRLSESGIPVTRVNVVIRTLHPQHVGLAYRWTRGDELESMTLSYALMQSPQWLESPLKPIYEGAGGIRRRLDIDAPLLDYPILEELRDAGATDYVAMPLVFSDGQPHAVTFTTDRRGGFETRDLGHLYEVLGVLARLYEVHQRRNLALNLLDTYLGRQTGERVLDGQVRRGDAQDISAVIWFCDLRESTALSARLGRHEFLALVNAVFDRLAAPVMEHGGEVLRFIGDAALAIFPIDAPAPGSGPGADEAAREALTRALAAVDDAVAAMAAFNAERAEAGRPPVGFGIGLHEGVVTYGNIGTDQRLEFTVVGEAANFAARIESLCKETGHAVLLSDAVAGRFPGRFRSVGEYALRGIPGVHGVHTLTSP